MRELREQVLEIFPVFRGLPPDAVDGLLANSNPLEVPAGTVMFESSSPCQAFPMLLKGAIRVAKTTENGRELLLYRVTPGESCILTSSCLLGNATYPARGVAESDLSGIVLSKAMFRKLVEESPVFRDYVFDMFASRLSDLMVLVEEVAFRRLDQRLASVLLAKGTPMLNVTHQGLADELGSAREIVSRLLKSFEEQGWVELGRQQIRLADSGALAALARPGVCN